MVVSDEDEFHDDDPSENDCDCMNAELDILTGIESCYICGRRRYLNSAEFKIRLEQNAEWEDEYYEYIQGVDNK